MCNATKIYQMYERHLVTLSFQADNLFLPDRHAGLRQTTLWKRKKHRSLQLYKPCSDIIPPPPRDNGAGRVKERVWDRLIQIPPPPIPPPPFPLPKCDTKNGLQRVVGPVPRTEAGLWTDSKWPRKGSCRVIFRTLGLRRRSIISKCSIMLHCNMFLSRNTRSHRQCIIIIYHRERCGQVQNIIQHPRICGSTVHR
jgi:hypothetical protein